MTDTQQAALRADSIAKAQADSVAQARADSLAAVRADSVARAQAEAKGIPVVGLAYDPPAHPGAGAMPVDTLGSSLVTGGLLALFCIVAIKFRNNGRYFVTLLRDLTVVRLRQNVFDDTVRETSFLVVLNLLETACAGVLLSWGLLPGAPTPLQTGVCVAVCGAYALGMWLAYAVVGNVFSDAPHTRMWVRGYGASQGLLGLLLLPLALLCICYPEEARLSALIGLGCFILAKLVFVWKGFRIFFTQISSWVLFLYYLCSLEVVPLLITAAAAVGLCSNM